MPKLIVNGKERELEHSKTVAELLKSLDLHERRVAVMVNDDIVRREQREETPLAEGDRVEIIQMVGGG